ncbi:LemA family protein [Teredinibacter purpureus]|uniref:LemA family protein n=1 Tax=Teredinibacter purpureus TaxID=2731756 RepID=UPI000695F78A|nr:LemA family protein [Teredinibacter purpureus]
MDIVKRILSLIGAIGLACLAFFLAEKAFQSLLDFRILERIPHSSIMGSTHGEVQLRGVIEAGPSTVTAPRSMNKTIYYRYLEEEEYRDSDGNTQWRTLRDESNAADFYLRDNSSSALIIANSSLHSLHWTAPQKLRQTKGGRRYTEWRLDVNQWVSLFGWLEHNDNNVTVNFQTSGDYIPIVSSAGAAAERSNMGWWVVLLLSGAISALVLMCFCIIYALAIHKVIIYLTLVSLSCTTLLLHYGWKSVESDVQNGHQRFLKQHSRAGELIQTVAARYNLSLNDSTTIDFAQAPFSAVADMDQQRINGWQLSRYILRERYLEQINTFPESLYAHTRHLNAPIAVPLSQEQQALADTERALYTSTRTPHNRLLDLLALAFTLGTAWLAFTFIRVKRIQENLPTSKTTGVTVGLTEVVGQLKAQPQAETLRGPLTNQPCCWYHYTVTEKRGSGKNSRWVTLEDRIEKQPFYCTDNEGELRVFPSNAEIITEHHTTQRRGIKRYSEKRLSPNDTLYLLGKAVTDKTTGNTLVLTHEKGSPFIISNKPENTVMLMKAAKGMLALSASVSLMFLALLMIAGSNGQFSSLDFLNAAMAAPIFLGCVMLIIMFNDLIFLRQRCHRGWANIQISLKKRATLIPRLEKIATTLLAHEKALLTQIATLRTQRNHHSSATEVDAYRRNEHQLLCDLSVIFEQYPDLKTNNAMQDLHRRMVKLENEIEMMRKGFNDAVLHYNTRIQNFPDCILSTLFRFKRIGTLSFESNSTVTPIVDIHH